MYVFFKDQWDLFCKQAQKNDFENLEASWPFNIVMKYIFQNELALVIEEDSLVIFRAGDPIRLPIPVIQDKEFLSDFLIYCDKKVKEHWPTLHTTLFSVSLMAQKQLGHHWNNIYLFFSEEMNNDSSPLPSSPPPKQSDPLGYS